MSTALVLGGGGVTGIGWELGMVKGLADAGVDLAAADRVVGTSAGSVVGAQLASGQEPDVLYDAQLAPPDAEIGAAWSRGTALRMVAPMLLPGPVAAKRRRVGRAALRAHPESANPRLEVIRSRIGVTQWPERDLRIVAVNATTGHTAVLTRTSGVDIVHAVAASCAVPLVWPPVPIDGVPHIDGGIRSTANADLAAGADRVVVLAPIRYSSSRRASVRAQIARLGAGVRSIVISPDREALMAIGDNLLDPAKRADSARAGRRQAADVVEAVRAVWQ